MNGNKKERTLILYSGGVDSTVLAGLYARQGHRLDLITFYNGAQQDLDLAKVHLPHIRRINPLIEINHSFSNVSAPFKKLIIRGIKDDSSISEFTYICVGCKLIMHSKAIVFAKQNEIFYFFYSKIMPCCKKSAKPAAKPAPKKKSPALKKK